MSRPGTYLLLLALVGCASTRPVPPTASAVPIPTPAGAPAASVLDRAVLRDRVLLAGQPTAIELQGLSQRGVTRVINLRTPEEMNDRSSVDFDEAALLADAGIGYEQLPIGGANHPYRPEVLDAFAKAYEASEGTVLLHCASGSRAAMLYAAYEVKYRGKSPDEAMRGLADFGGWPLPLERLTGIPLRLDRRD